MFISGMDATAFDYHGWCQYDKNWKAECKIFAPETVCCNRGVNMQRETRSNCPPLWNSFTDGVLKLREHYDRACVPGSCKSTDCCYSSQYSSSGSFSSREVKLINRLFAGSSSTVRAQIQHCFPSYMQPWRKWMGSVSERWHEREDDGLWLNNVKWKYSVILTLRNMSYEKSTQKELLLQKAIIFYGYSICQHYTSMNDVFKHIWLY